MAVGEDREKDPRMESVTREEANNLFLPYKITSFYILYLCKILFNLVKEKLSDSNLTIFEQSCHCIPRKERMLIIG